MKIILLAWVREVMRAPLQTTLSVLGVALGVTAVISVQVANHSARESFLAASSKMEETATHTIFGELSDELYRQIRLDTDFPAQPVVKGRVRIEDANGDSITVLGIDPISYFEFNRRLVTSAKGSREFIQLMAEPHTVFATADTLRRLGVEIGDSIKVRYGSNYFDFRVTALIETTTPLKEQSFRFVFVTDIATAQTVLGMRGKLTSIQLRLPSGNQALDSIRTLLPRGAQLEGRVNRQRSQASITEAFQINLTAMSLLALAVAVFLIYNTVTFLVVRRKPTIKILRALGASNAELSICVILEAVLVGLAASAIGFLVGAQLAKFLLLLVEKSISNLYFPIDADITILTPAAFFLALALGIGSTILATLPSLREALNIVPSFGTAHLPLDMGGQKRALIILIISAGLVVSGIALMQIYPTSIVPGLVSIYLIVAGYFCLVPMMCKILGKSVRFVAKRLFGVRGVLASRALVMTGGRSSVAICALCIAVAAIVGVGVMISSFRMAVDSWIIDRLSADVYVSTRESSDQLIRHEVDKLTTIPGVEFVGIANWTWLQGPDGRSRVFAVDYGKRAFEGYRFKSQIPDVWNQFQSEGVIVSEPYAWKHDVAVGDSIEFWNGDDTVQMQVLGIFFDYSSDRGMVVMHRDVYIANFADHTITTAALFGDSSANLEVFEDFANRLITSPGAAVWNVRGLHEASMEIFDQTFAITAVLRTLAVIVAFIAVMSTLAMIQIDRAQELRVQSAIGFTSRETWMSASIESGVMGLIAGVLSLPVGLLLSWLFIRVVNQRSFGWTMEMLVDKSILAEAVFLAVLAALLAGIVSSWWLASRAPKQTLQEE